MYKRSKPLVSVFCVKIYGYLGEISKEPEPFTNSHKVSLSVLKAFTAENVFAVSLHQMTGKHCFMLASTLSLEIDA